MRRFLTWIEDHLLLPWPITLGLLTILIYVTIRFFALRVHQ